MDRYEDVVPLQSRDFPLHYAALPVLALVRGRMPIEGNDVAVYTCRSICKPKSQGNSGDQERRCTSDGYNFGAIWGVQVLGGGGHFLCLV